MCTDDGSPMTAEDVLKKYLQDNLNIRIDKEYTYSGTYLTVTLSFGKEEISSSSILLEELNK